MNSVIGPCIGIVGVFGVLMLAEALRAKKVLRHAETMRKFVHILTGMFVAAWPFFMSTAAIQVLSVLMLLVVLASKHLHIFKSIHGVGRQTIGELLFPVSIFLCATFAQSDWVYAAAVLHLSLADGLAATVGVRHLKRFSYKVFGQTKTVIGTATFFVMSLLITAAVMIFASNDYILMSQAIILLLPLTATLLENVAVYGSDNVLVPLYIIVMLNSLQNIG